MSMVMASMFTVFIRVGSLPNKVNQKVGCSTRHDSRRSVELRAVDVERSAHLIQKGTETSAKDKTGKSTAIQYYFVFIITTVSAWLHRRCVDDMQVTVRDIKDRRDDRERAINESDWFASGSSLTLIIRRLKSFKFDEHGTYSTAVRVE